MASCSGTVFTISHTRTHTHTHSRPAQPKAVNPETDNPPSPSSSAQTQPVEEEREKGHSNSTEETPVLECASSTVAAIDGGASATRRCGSLVEFVSCYGPLLDSVRLKQLLGSKEWEERKTCLTAFTKKDRPVSTGQFVTYF